MEAGILYDEASQPCPRLPSLAWLMVPGKIKPIYTHSECMEVFDRWAPKTLADVI